MNHILIWSLAIASLTFLKGSDFVGYGSFMLNSNSARAIALSQSNTAWVSNLESIYSNSAGLASIDGFEVIAGFSLNNTNFTKDLNYNSGSIGYGRRIIRIPEIFMAFGLGYQGFTVGDIDEYDNFENYQGSFDFSEGAYSFAIAAKIYSLSLGIKWTYYLQDFGNYGYSHNNGEDLKSNYYRPTELGLQYRITKMLMIGLIYNKSTRIGQNDITPARLKLGFAVKNNKFIYGLDYERLSTNNGGIMSGVEDTRNIYRIPISFRLGGRVNVKDDSNDWDIKHNMYLTMGVGVLINDTKILKKSFQINIAMNQSAYPNLLSPLFRMIFVSVELF